MDAQPAADSDRSLAEGRSRRTVLGRSGCVLGFVLVVAGWLVAFSVPGAILIFAGLIVGFVGLAVLLIHDRSAWALLAALAVLLALLHHVRDRRAVYLNQHAGHDAHTSKVAISSHKD
ncbi:MAG: hypothetical protein ACRDHF_11110 [Tepidiformaceae bacterium]